MSDVKNNGQLTFDFSDFSDDGRSPGMENPERKIPDDRTPELFDPEVSEEEEMRDFLRKIHPLETQTPAGEPELSAPDFPFDRPAVAVSEKKFPEKKPLTRKQLQRASLAFLASLNPSGLAADVLVCGGRVKAPAAAFRIESGKIVWTAVAEIRTAADAALETIGSTELLEQLRLARLEREVLEQDLRRTAPELREDSMLFSEFEQWNYEKSENSAYQECLRRIRRLEYSMFHGSRLGRIQSARIGSDLYLIVPEKAVEPAALASGWGLVYVKQDLSFELIKKPGRITVPEENRVRIALNIAASNVEEVLFCNGISVDSGGRIHCGPLPRRRRRKS